MCEAVVLLIEFGKEGKSRSACGGVNEESSKTRESAGRADDWAMYSLGIGGGVPEWGEREGAECLISSV